MRPFDDPLKPRRAGFSEPWHAQTLAMAQALVAAGHATAEDWAKALGRALSEAEADGQPDTEETYFRAALTAVERLAFERTSLTREALQVRKEAWANAYRQTPHGAPVALSNVPRHD